MNRNYISRPWVSLLASLLAFAYGGAQSVQGATLTWSTTSGDWFAAGNWSPVQQPAAGDSVVINAGADILLTNATPVLADLTMNGGTFTFSNWNTRVEAANVVISGGTLTLPPAFTTNQMSNRVWIVCTNFTLGTNAAINASQKGFARGYGPGVGDAVYGGAGHGGAGGAGNNDGPGSAYDSLTAPIEPGSGGANTTIGGHGGGAVRIDAGGTATIFGSITANGGQYVTTHGPGGSGGSIYISCTVFAGSENGLLQANGGRQSNNGGCGAGGRIAVVYDPGSQPGNPGVRMQTARGTTAYLGTMFAEDGTVYLPDAKFLSSSISGQLFRDCFLTIAGLTEWNLDSLSISNSSFVLAGTGVVVTVTNALTLDSGGIGLVSNGELRCGSISMTGSSEITMYAGPTNGVSPEYGALVSVTGDVSVGAGCWIYPVSHETDGGSVLFDIGGNVAVEAGAGFNANYAGFGPSRGPGAGLYNTSYGGGGSYGGRGAPYTGSLRSSPYGRLTAPTLPGSGGGHTTRGGRGGGLVWIVATNGTVTVQGTMTANGEVRNIYHYGSGAGGGIYVQCKQFDGDSGGLLRVNGANTSHSGGAGGGGRIAVVYDTATQSGYNPGVRFEAACGASGYSSGLKAAENGTVYLTDGSFLSDTLDNDQYDDVFVTFGGDFTNWVLDSLTVGQADLAIANTGLVITVSNTVTLGTVADFGIMNGSTLTCSNLVTSFNVLNGDASTLRLYAGATNGTGPDYGVLLEVNGTMTLESNVTVYAYSDDVNGGSPLLRINNLTVNPGGAISADGRGYAPDYGPGYGTSWGGGGYGGKGGDNSVLGQGGDTYGSGSAPAQPGSGADEYAGGSGSGGGLVRIESSGTLDLRGTLTAIGFNGTTTHCPGGSGGGVFLKCRAFEGHGTGKILAYGGNAVSSLGGGGGGGRIAVWRFSDQSTGAITTDVHPGTGRNNLPSVLGSGTGTVFWVISAPAITNLSAQNIGLTSADMVGQLTATGFSPTVVRCYWGDTDRGGDMALWANTNDLGVLPVGVHTNSRSDLVAGTVYHYRFYATNDAGDVWSTPSASFSTLGGGVTVHNLDPLNVEPASVTLRGEVTQGNPSPDAHICWGTLDGGNLSTGDWQNVIGVGPNLGIFSAPVTGLLANKTYFYRCYAENTNASDWADSTTNVVTAGPYVSIGDASVDEGHSGTVDLTFTVSLSTASVVDVSVTYATANGSADAGTDYHATNGVLTISSNQLSGTIVVEVIGDVEDEFPSQDLTVNLSAPTACSLVDAQGLGTIVDDDAAAETNTWNGTGNWTDTTKWSQGRVPRDVDYAIVGSGSVLLSGSDTVHSLTVNSGAAMTFTNWTTTLTASNVVVGGTLALPPAFNIVQMSNRVHIVCTDLTVATNGLVDASAAGFAAANGPGKGAAYGITFGSGAGHGAVGGVGAYRTAGGQECGSTNQPVLPGSGGGLSGGGSGGGAVRIDALGTVTVFGTVRANGSNGGSPNYGGGGSGGSILVNCHILDGSVSGLLQANGGSGYGGNGGRGAGGRIAVNYNTTAQAGRGNPGVRTQAAVGLAGYRPSMDGTLYLPDTQFLSTVMDKQLFRDLVLHVPGFSSWSVASLTLADAGLTFGEPGFQLTVAGDLVLNKGDLGLMGNAMIDCGGDLAVTNASVLTLYSGPTNGVGPAYGTLVDVDGAMLVGSGSWVYPHSDETNGGSALFRVGSVDVQSGGGFNANSMGFANLAGPGAGSGTTPYGSGGGYGGRGAQGNAIVAQGLAYGSLSAPALPGSGGGEANLGGYGGGLIWIEATNGSATVNGTLTANGENPRSTHGAGGSGGGIYIHCQTLGGSSTGLLRANGGNGNNGGGAGGGGRVSVVYDTVAQAGVYPGVGFQARRGVGGFNAGYSRDSQDGTVFFSDASVLEGTTWGSRFGGGRLYAGAATNFAAGSLTVDGASVVLAGAGFRMTVTNGVTVRNDSLLGIEGDVRFACGTLTLEGGGDMAVVGGPTNGAADYSALVSVGGSMSIASGCWAYAYSDFTNGGSGLFRAGALNVAAYGGFDASGFGFQHGQGPGLGTGSWGGGGYGGKGGNGAGGVGGPAYGSSNMPVSPGSGGYPYGTDAGNGGGVVRVEVRGRAAIDGTIQANAGNARSSHGPGGAGGSVFLMCGRLATSGSTVLRANGANGIGNGGAGAGGRIAVAIGVDKDRLESYDAGSPIVVYSEGTDPDFLGTTSVTNGTGYYSPPDSRAAAPGTVVFLRQPHMGTMILFK